MPKSSNPFSAAREAYVIGLDHGAAGHPPFSRFHRQGYTREVTEACKIAYRQGWTDGRFMEEATRPYT